MTAPNQPTPDGSIELGQFKALQDATPEDTQAALTQGARVSYGNAHSNMGSQVRDPLGGAIVNAGTALTEAQAAVNAAAAAENKADTAYAHATEWNLEFVVASAEVTEGAGEILVGPMIKVRDGRVGLLTDIHIALLEQHDGLTVETRIWDISGTTYRVAHTTVIGADVTRLPVSAIDQYVYDQERFFPYVVDIVGTVPPTVLQIHLHGVYVDEPEEP